MTSFWQISIIRTLQIMIDPPPLFRRPNFWKGGVNELLFYWYLWVLSPPPCSPFIFGSSARFQIWAPPISQLWRHKKSVMPSWQARRRRAKNSHKTVFSKGKSVKNEVKNGPIPENFRLRRAGLYNPMNLWRHMIFQDYGNPICHPPLLSGISASKGGDRWSDISW